MSRDDLLADLTTEAAARPAVPRTPPTVGPPTAVRPTPAFDVTVTPLRWSLPSIGPVPAGIGLALRVGPLQVSAALR